MGECLHRLGACLPNEKSDLITLPLPQLSELVFLIRVRRNYSSLWDGRWCGGGSVGGEEGDDTVTSAMCTTGYYGALTASVMQDF